MQHFSVSFSDEESESLSQIGIFCMPDGPGCGSWRLFVFFTCLIFFTGLPFLCLLSFLMGLGQVSLDFSVMSANLRLDTVH